MNYLRYTVNQQVTLYDGSMNFNPNLSPKEVILLGSFGGSYFGFPIEEHIDYNYQELFNYHFKELDTALYLGEVYKPRLNQYKVRSGRIWDGCIKMILMDILNGTVNTAWEGDMKTMNVRLKDGMEYADQTVDGEIESIR